MSERESVCVCVNILGNAYAAMTCRWLDNIYDVHEYMYHTNTDRQTCRVNSGAGVRMTPGRSYPGDDAREIISG